MTAPNGLAQQELIERCLAQIDDEKKRKLHFWECHGTGTALGDPVEFLALARALSHAKMPSQVISGTAVHFQFELSNSLFLSESEHWSY